MAEKLNFAHMTALVADGDNYAVGILGQILRGFGLTLLTTCENADIAKRHLQRTAFDLVVVEYTLPDVAGTELVRWIRRLPDQTARTVPIIVLTGYTQYSNVTGARDSGANCVVRKPVAPSVLYDRLAWSADGDRRFVETATYVGPCRRFKFTGPPDGVGRRSTDLPAEIGDAVEPNMSQSEIDSIMKPTKVSIE